MKQPKAGEKLNRTEHPQDYNTTEITVPQIMEREKVTRGGTGTGFSAETEKDKWGGVGET